MTPPLTFTVKPFGATISGCSSKFSSLGFSEVNTMVLA